MSFIKRSTTQIRKAKVGKLLCDCVSCGMPFVCEEPSNTCPRCIAAIALAKNETTEDSSSAE